MIDYWNGGDNVLKNLDRKNITNLLECYEKACLLHPDCVGVSFEDHGYWDRLCYVWQNCDFDNLIVPDEDPKSWSLKRGNDR